MTTEQQDSAQKLARIVFFATLISAAIYAAVVFVFIIRPNGDLAPEERLPSPSPGSEVRAHD